MHSSCRKGKKYEYFETPIYIIMMLAGYETFEKCDIFFVRQGRQKI